MPDRIIFVLSNGKKFAGSYNRESGCFSGLSSMFRILGIENLKGVSKFLFTYDGTEVVSICAFDSENYEIVFPGTPLDFGNENQNLEMTSFIIILLSNDHRIYIPSIVVLCRC